MREPSRRSTRASLESLTAVSLALDLDASSPVSSFNLSGRDSMSRQDSLVTGPTLSRQNSLVSSLPHILVTAPASSPRLLNKTELRALYPVDTRAQGALNVPPRASHRADDDSQEEAGTETKVGRHHVFPKRYPWLEGHLFSMLLAVIFLTLLSVMLAVVMAEPSGSSQANQSSHAGRRALGFLSPKGKALF